MFGIFLALICVLTFSQHFDNFVNFHKDRITNFEILTYNHHKSPQDACQNNNAEFLNHSEISHIKFQKIIDSRSNKCDSFFLWGDIAEKKTKKNSIENDQSITLKSYKDGICYAKTNPGGFKQVPCNKNKRICIICQKKSNEKYSAHKTDAIFQNPNLRRNVFSLENSVDETGKIVIEIVTIIFFASSSLLMIFSTFIIAGICIKRKWSNSSIRKYNFSLCNSTEKYVNYFFISGCWTLLIPFAICIPCCDPKIQIFKKGRFKIILDKYFKINCTTSLCFWFTSCYFISLFLTILCFLTFSILAVYFPIEIVTSITAVNYSSASSILLYCLFGIFIIGFFISFNICTYHSLAYFFWSVVNLRIESDGKFKGKDFVTKYIEDLRKECPPLKGTLSVVCWHENRDIFNKLKSDVQRKKVKDKIITFQYAENIIFRQCFDLSTITPSFEKIKGENISVTSSFAIKYDQQTAMLIKTRKDQLFSAYRGKDVHCNVTYTPPEMKNEKILHDELYFTKSGHVPKEICRANIKNYSNFKSILRWFFCLPIFDVMEIPHIYEKVKFDVAKVFTFQMGKIDLTKVSTIDNFVKHSGPTIYRAIENPRKKVIKKNNVVKKNVVKREPLRTREPPAPIVKNVSKVKSRPKTKIDVERIQAEIELSNMMSGGVTGDSVKTLKFAFVVGMGKYEYLNPLKAPVGDAEAIGKLLEKRGFNVTMTINVDGEDLLDEFCDFQSLVTDELGKYGKDEVRCLIIFYFAGHGIFTEDDESLVPIDFNPDSFDIEVSLEKIKKLGAKEKERYLEDCIKKKRRELKGKLLTEAKIKSNLGSLASNHDVKFVLFLDACRNVKKMKVRFSLSEEKRGGRLKYIVSYSTNHKQYASDLSVFGKHSPYCRSLLKRLDEHDHGSLIDLLHIVKEDVEEETNNNQQPIISSTTNVKWPFVSKGGNVNTNTRGMSEKKDHEKKEETNDEKKGAKVEIRSVNGNVKIEKSENVDHSEKTKHNDEVKKLEETNDVEENIKNENESEEESEEGSEEESEDDEEPISIKVDEKTVLKEQDLEGAKKMLEMGVLTDQQVADCFSSLTLDDIINIKKSKK